MTPVQYRALFPALAGQVWLDIPVHQLIWPKGGADPGPNQEHRCGRRDGAVASRPDQNAGLCSIQRWTLMPARGRRVALR